MSTRERRVTLALKWHHLDNLDVEEIQERFEREGVGSYARSTVRKYLNEQPKEEVLEMIEQRHADIRLQSAERHEQLYQRAREAEFAATEDRPIIRVVPKTDRVPGDRQTPKQVPDWEVVDVDDEAYPEWASERDVIIRFTDGVRQVRPGEEYPIRAVDGSPRYTKEFDGLRRDQPDRKQRALARQEQSHHLHEKADVLGAYDETDLNISGEVDHSHEHEHGLDEETESIIDDLADDLKA